MLTQSDTIIGTSGTTVELIGFGTSPQTFGVLCVSATGW